MKRIRDKYEQLVRIGTEGIIEEEEVNRIKTVNTLSLIFGVALLFIGSIASYLLNWRLDLVIPFAIEFVLNSLVIYLNHTKKHQAASLLVYILQCAAITYFGQLLGPALQLQFAVIFLISINYLIFKKSKLRILTLLFAMGTMAVLEFNYYKGPALTIPDQAIYILHTLVIGAVLFIVIYTSKPYVDNNDGSYQLKRIDQFKRIFLAQVTHELRTPLNAVHGAAQLLIKEIHSDPGLKSIEPLAHQLLAASNNARVLVNNVLNMAQIEAGILETSEIKPFLLHRFFADIVNVHKVIAHAREMRLELVIEKMPDVVLADMLKLNQITTNLLANAIKYAYKKSTVRLKITRSPDDLDKWCLQVINEGPGISPDKLSTIFDPFISEKQEKYVESTGLGLYIVKKKVESIGGSIEVESQMGGYTSFTVIMPLSRGLLKDIASEEERDKEHQYNFTGIKILLADDEPLNALMLGRFLEMNGCHVTKVTDGHEVLESLTKEMFDLIIMDYHMPRMDGIQTVKALRENKATENLPVIIATGDLFKESQDKLLAAGADAVVEKPIEHKVLLQVINWHLLQHANKEALER